jgi:MFS superfamily sulfate permease-like transporter
VKILSYQKSELPHDLVAGLSVAAVALPVAVAYAQLAGFNPAVGLYSSILPLVAYAIFGTSRQLVIGPDAMTCALVAAAVAPLASGDQTLYDSASVTLALLAGVLCILASFLRLSKPILVGFLNGVALSIMLGQIGKIFGFPITAGGILPRLLEFVTKIDLTQWSTLGVALGTFLVHLGSPKLPSFFLMRLISSVRSLQPRRLLAPHYVGSCST